MLTFMVIFWYIRYINPLLLLSVQVKEFMK